MTIENGEMYVQFSITMVLESIEYQEKDNKGYNIWKWANTRSVCLDVVWFLTTIVEI